VFLGFYRPSFSPPHDFFFRHLKFRWCVFLMALSPFLFRIPRLFYPPYLVFFFLFSASMRRQRARNSSFFLPANFPQSFAHAQVPRVPNRADLQSVVLLPSRTSFFLYVVVASSNGSCTSCVSVNMRFPLRLVSSLFSPLSSLLFVSPFFSYPLFPLLSELCDASMFFTHLSLPPQS